MNRDHFAILLLVEFCAGEDGFAGEYWFMVGKRWDVQIIPEMVKSDHREATHAAGKAWTKAEFSWRIVGNGSSTLTENAGIPEDLNRSGEKEDRSFRIFEIWIRDFVTTMKCTIIYVSDFGNVYVKSNIPGINNVETDSYYNPHCWRREWCSNPWVDTKGALMTSTSTAFVFQSQYV